MPEGIHPTERELLDQLVETLESFEKELSPQLSLEGVRLRTRAQQLLAAFRDALVPEINDFAQKVGVNSRTVTRWLTDSPPGVLQVHTWRDIFAETFRQKALKRCESDYLPRLEGVRPGVFSLATIGIRIREAAEIWCLKHRCPLHVSDSAAAREFFKVLLLGGGFKMHCVWVKPEDDPDPRAPRPPLTEVFPAVKVPESLVTVYQCSFPEVLDLETKVFGYEVPVNEAFRFGLSNTPTSTLVIVYKDSSKYKRSVDVFTEQLSDGYNEDGSPYAGKPLEFWNQATKNQALDYFYKIWRNFSGIESHLKSRAQLEKSYDPARLRFSQGAEQR